MDHASILNEEMGGSYGRAFNPNDLPKQLEPPEIRSVRITQVIFEKMVGLIKDG
ncbi:hypothetical protein EGR_08083 [Echinococcus granulosus]|uniref:Uncharacterized protein n=1 Tax=Echinococcus granulosus TaxID=6210 RepID=W6UUK9_ECHGR|nr:hypothetical protein EGR_08083 [Echinococcus granulosus]EUB57074.1 hypothetical protein EGR_08083 [Echinococcus granulosus]